MSVRIMLKHELRPSSLTCSRMVREPGCHFAFLREGGGGGWLWSFFPLAAQSPSGFEAVSQFQTNPKGRLKASSSLSVLSLLANPLQRSYNACSPSNLRSTILFTRCKQCIPPAAATEAVPASALFALWGWLLAQPRRGSSAASSKHITVQTTAQRRAFSFSEISPAPPRAQRLGAAPALQPADFIWALCWCQGKRGDMEVPAHPAQPSGSWAAP